MTDDIQQRLNEYLARIDADFKFCVTEVLRLCKKKVGGVQLDLADWMQYGPQKCGVLGTRGIAKTTIAEIYCLWRLRKNPNEHIGLISKSAGHAKKSMTEMRKWMDDIPFFRHLCPNKALGDRDSTTEIDVRPKRGDRIPSIAACGIEGQLTGNHFTILIPDDVETPENTVTQKMRDILEAKMQEAEHMAVPGARIIYLGTYHHEDSLYLKLAQEKGNIKGMEHLSKYEFRSWPAFYPKPAEFSEIPFIAKMYKEHLDSGKAKAGQPVWPEYLNIEYFAALHITKTNFGMQCMLKPKVKDGDRTPLKHGDLMVFDCHPYNAPISMAWGTNSAGGSTIIEEIDTCGFEGDRFYRPAMISSEWGRYHGTKAFLDPAGVSTKRDGDETSWAIIGQLNGILHVKYLDGIKLYDGQVSENLETIVKTLRKYDARELYIEKERGGDYLVPLIQPIIARYVIPVNDDGTSSNQEFPFGWNCSVEAVSSGRTQKEARIIDRLEPVMGNHRIVVDRSVAADTKLMYQLTRITREKGCLDHDDRIDCLSSCVDLWKEALDQDAQATAEKNSATQAEENVRKYLASLGIETHQETIFTYAQTHQRYYG